MFSQTCPRARTGKLQYCDRHPSPRRHVSIGVLFPLHTYLSVCPIFFVCFLLQICLQQYCTTHANTSTVSQPTAPPTPTVHKQRKFLQRRTTNTTLHASIFAVSCKSPTSWPDPRSFRAYLRRVERRVARQAVLWGSDVTVQQRRLELLLRLWLRPRRERPAEGAGGDRSDSPVRRQSIQTLA